MENIRNRRDIRVIKSSLILFQENSFNTRDIKLVTTNKRRNELALESNYHPTKHALEELLAIEMNKKM